MDTSTKHSCTCSSENIEEEEEGAKDCKSSKIREFVVRLWHLVISETTPIKSQKNDYPSMSFARTTAIDKPKWTEK